MSTYTDTLVAAADAILTGLAEDGGATVDIHTGHPVELTHGYVVSIDGYGWTWRANWAALHLSPNGDSIDRVQQYVNQAAVWIDSLTMANPVYVGAWHDDSTDTIHLDLSAVFSGREFALTVAREQNQLAIWDVDNGVEVRVADADIDYTGDDDELHPDDVQGRCVSLRKAYSHHSDVRNPLSTFANGRVLLGKS